MVAVSPKAHARVCTMGIRIRRNGISDNVVPTLQAANMYMIAELVEECNMNVQKKLKPDGLLIVLSVLLNR